MDNAKVRMRSFQASPTSSLNASIKRLAAEGRPIYHLSAGEVGGQPPEHVLHAAARAATSDSGHGYGVIAGLAALREHVAADAGSRSGQPTDLENVVVTNGAKQAVFVACQLLLEPGDRALVPTPAWPTYQQAISLAGGLAVAVPACREDGFLVSADDLDASRHDRARILILSSPVNPTGEIYDAGRLREVGRWCAENGIVVIFDEIYRHIRFAGCDQQALRTLSESGAAVVAVDGVSKTYAMAGWRVGWMVAPAEVAKAAAAVMSHTTNHVGYVQQVAALAALQGPQDDVAERVARLAANRATVLKMFAEVSFAKLRPPMGSFYAFPSFEPVIGPGRVYPTGVDLAEDVLEHAGVAVVPGAHFGADTHMRLSFSKDGQELAEGIRRLLGRVSARHEARE